MDDTIRLPDDRSDGDAYVVDRPRRHRRVPVVLWWIGALHVTLLLLYSVLLPTFRAPDEPQHVDLSHVFAEDFRCPAWFYRLVSIVMVAPLPFVVWAVGRRVGLP